MEKKYQIFISSTFADLEEERKEVMEAILNLDCFPAGMEMFPAADIEQFEYIKTIIDQSDYYILIIAGRYGSVAEDGKSYTEKEYEYAKEQGIPVLVFVKKDIDNLLVSQTDNNLNLKEKLLNFRKSAMQNRLAKYWNDKMELKYNVHDSLSKAFKLNPRAGWIKGDTATDIKTLKELEKIREKNFKLQEENDKLKEILLEKDEVENISQEDDEITIRCKYGNSDSIYTEEFNIPWNNLFALAGPSLVAAQAINQSKNIFDKAMKRYTNKERYYYFNINEDDFNTIKIQFDALGLIKYFVANKVGGGVAEFMQLTNKGREKLKLLKIKRK